MESLQDVFNKPKKFTPNKNSIGKDWNVWKEQFLTYLKLIDTCSKLPEKGKALLLFNLMGQEAIIAKEKIVFQDPSEEENIDILFKKFDELFNPPLNEMEERYKFFSRRKYTKESIDNYIADMQEQAAKCNFGDQIDKFIIDMIILSMDKHIQKRTFLLKDISLSDTIKVYKESFINDKRMQDACFEKPMNLNSENFNNAKTTNPLKFNRIDKEEIQQSKLPESSPKNYKSNNIKKTSIVDNIFKDFTIISKDDLYTNNLGINQNKADTSSGSKTENCLWCESKHIQGQCQHNLTCVRCDRFPHKICFQCKKNPHDDNCYYKTIIILPVNNSSNIVPSCSKCDTNHPCTQCPAKNEVCLNCFEVGHFTWTCKNSKTAEKVYCTQNQQSANDPNKNNSSKTVPVCSKCATYHPYKQCPVSSGTNEANAKRVCSRCGTNHPYKQCPAFSGNNEAKSKPVCSRCGTNHPYKQCPAFSGNNEAKSKPVCSRCGTNHPYKQCPAFIGNNEAKAKPVCSRCGTNHPFNPCPAFSGNNEAKAKPVCSRCGTNHPFNPCPAFSGNNEANAKRVCSRCGTNHPYKQCPAFSGNNEAKSKPVCSRCGTNHPFNPCPANKNNDIKPKRIYICSKCGTNHPYKQCPACNQRCSKCHQMGHYDWTCKNQQVALKYVACPSCSSKRLQHHEEMIFYCSDCRNYMEIISSDEDFDSSVTASAGSTENRQSSKPCQKRKPTKRDDKSGCCIS